MNQTKCNLSSLEFRRLLHPNKDSVTGSFLPLPGIIPSKTILLKLFRMCRGKFNKVIIMGHIEYVTLWWLKGLTPSVQRLKAIPLGSLSKTPSNTCFQTGAL